MFLSFFLNEFEYRSASSCNSCSNCLKRLTNDLRRCACEEPRDPSNETLRFWEERNITPSQVNWTMLEVKVRIPLHLEALIAGDSQLQQIKQPGKSVIQSAVLSSSRPLRMDKEPKEDLVVVYKQLSNVASISYSPWQRVVSQFGHTLIFFQKRHKSRQGLRTCGLDFTGFSRAEWAWRFSLKSGFTRRPTQIIGASSGRLYHSYTWLSEVLEQVDWGGGG